MLGNLISGFIIILVGVTLAPTVASEVKNAQFPNGNASAAGNITGAASTIIGLSTLFYCLGVATVGIGIAVIGLRQGGLM